MSLCLSGRRVCVLHSKLEMRPVLRLDNRLSVIFFQTIVGFIFGFHVLINISQVHHLIYCMKCKVYNRLLRRESCLCCVQVVVVAVNCNCRAISNWCGPPKGLMQRESQCNARSHSNLFSNMRNDIYTFSNWNQNQLIEFHETNNRLYENKP